MRKFFGALSALALLTWKVVAADVATLDRPIVLKENAEVWSSTVCLNDLVDDSWIRGRCLIDRETCCRWRLDQERTAVFNRVDLQGKLSNLEFGGVHPSLTGADEIRVNQVGRALDENEISAAVAKSFETRGFTDRETPKISQLKINVPIYVSFEKENDWEVSLPEGLGNQVTVRIQKKSAPDKALGWAQMQVSFFKEVFVAKKTIRPGDEIKIENFTLKKIDVFSIAAHEHMLISKDAFPLGVRARLSILTGSPLLNSQIEKQPLVKLGDVVTLILRSDNLKVSTKGVAQGTGAAGDMVTVQLSRYNRSFRGRLVDAKVVEVWL